MLDLAPLYTRRSKKARVRRRNRSLRAFGLEPQIVENQVTSSNNRNLVQSDWMTPLHGAGPESLADSETRLRTQIDLMEYLYRAAGGVAPGRAPWTSRPSSQHGEELGGFDDRNPLERMENQQILIAGDEGVRAAFHRHLEELVVFGVAARFQFCARFYRFTPQQHKPMRDEPPAGR